MKCEACERGDHANCGMQSWCSCNDERDGDLYAMPDFDETEASLQAEQAARERAARLSDG